MESTLSSSKLQTLIRFVLNEQLNFLGFLVIGVVGTFTSKTDQRQYVVSILYHIYSLDLNI